MSSVSDIAPSPQPDGEPSPGSKTWPRPLAAISLFVLGAFMAKLWMGLNLPFPVCLLRKLTGVPCPTCGCTRSLAAWTRLDVGQAFVLNPLFFLVCVSVLIWFAARAIESKSARTLLPALAEVLKKHLGWKVFAAAVLINWIYLCLTLPK